MTASTPPPGSRAPFGEPEPLRLRPRLVIAGAVALVALPAAVLTEPIAALTTTSSPWLDAAVRCVLAIAGVAGLVVAVRLVAAVAAERRPSMGNVRLPAAPDGSLADRLPGREDLRKARMDVQQRYYDEAIASFGRMLINPAYRLRLEAKFVIDGDMARTTSRADFIMSLSERNRLVARSLEERADGNRIEGPRTVPVPLMWLPKGSFLDDLVITDARNVRLVKLPPRDTTALIGWTLGPLFDLAFTRPGQPRTAGGDEIVEEIRRLVAVRERVEAREILAEFDRLVAPLVTAFPDDTAADEATRRQLQNYANFRAFVRQAATSYVLAVEAPIPAGVTLSLHYTSSVPVRTIERLGLGGVVSSLFALEPSKFEIPVRAASLFANYHAELDERARAQYVASHDVVARSFRNEATDSPPSAEGLFTPDRQDTADPANAAQLRLLNDSGYSYPRLHLINYGKLASYPPLGWRVALREIPPGSLAPILGLSMATSLVALVFTFAATTMTQPDLNAPTLVLATTALLLTVLGFSYPQLRRSSLATMIGFWGSIVIVVFSAFSLVGVQPLHLPQQVRQPRVVDLPMVFAPAAYWPTGLCAAAGILLGLYLTVVLLARQRVYREHRRDGYSTRIGGGHGR